MKLLNSRIWLITELLVLFAGIPLVLYFTSLVIHPSSLLIPALLVIFVLLRYTTAFKWKELIKFGIHRSVLFRNAVIVLVISILLFAYVYLFDRDNLFNLPRANPLIWLGLSIFYPLFSAYLQEILYRTYFYRRYSGLFGSDSVFILVSAAAFSLVHIVYYNPVSIVLTFFAGLYFAAVYVKTKSVLFTSILHGILGIVIFTVGLGQYFWLDMMNYL